MSGPNGMETARQLRQLGVQFGPGLCDGIS